MSERIGRPLATMASVSMGLAAVAGLRVGPAFAVGVLSGGAWSLVNLWCLARALRVWLAPQTSRRRAVAWFLVKFPLVYAVAIALLMRSPAHAAGFGVGLTLVLLSALAASLLTIQHAAQPVVMHGR